MAYPYAQKLSRPSGMSVADYHRWLYGEDGGYTINTSSSFSFQLVPSEEMKPREEVRVQLSSPTSRVVYSFNPKKIIRNGPATVVFWPDNTKTVVKCADGDNDSTYTAFCAALAQKIFGSNSKVKKMVSKMTEEQKL